MNITLPASRIQQDFVPFKGGLDVVSPPVTIPSGFVRRSYNFEEDINGGYVSLTGYERFDGRASPSSAEYALLPYSTAGTVAVGNIITGAISGASATVIAVVAEHFVITKITGTFQAESTSTLGAVITGSQLISGEVDAKTNAQYKSLAANSYRSSIQAVPGSGNILGVWYYKGVVYAFRNNSNATAVDMYKSTTGGWSKVSLGYEVYFDTGSGTEPLEGSTITKGVVSGVLKRIVIESGTFGAGTAAGRLIFSSITNTPFTAGAFTGGITANCVLQSAITIPNINGRFEFVNANFTGSDSTLRMYGCDGKNRGFEFDGTTFVPINTGIGAALDKPTHVSEHQNHLFFSIGSSAYNSAIGNPLNWTSILGASELTFSDTVTGFKTQPGSETTAAIAIYCRNKTYILYGTSAASWHQVKINDEGGAIPYSIQIIGQTFVMDDRGVTTLASTQQFGNFAESTISKRIKTYLTSNKNNLSDSHVSREKQQYRLFYNDGAALYFTLDANNSSVMTQTLVNPVLCSCSVESYTGVGELIFFGSTNGFIYQMERGTSFDGVAIESYIETVYNHSGTYRNLKKYRRMTLEILGTGYAEWNVGYWLNDGDYSHAQPDYIPYAENITGAYFWDEFIWDLFYWDGVYQTSYTIPIEGDSDNLSVRVLLNSDYNAPIKISGAFIEYSTLRMRR